MNAKVITAEESAKSERVISFSGYKWAVKSSENSISGTMGPGDNHFSDSSENVWVDKKGWLHLKTTKKNGRLHCAEVTLTMPLGYKKYIFQVNSRIDLFHPNIVGGFFTYLDGRDNAEEIDIEFSGWGDSTKVNNAQFAIQPSDTFENKDEFEIELNGIASTHLFDWKPGNVSFASYHGHYSSLPADSALIIRKWNYSGTAVPINPNGKVHINLWIFEKGKIDPSNYPEAEMVIKNFQAL